MDRDTITSKIRNVTNILDKNGFITAATNRIVHFSKHIDIIPDEEFEQTVRLWIECIQTCIIKFETTDNFLKLISESDDRRAWINDYLYIKSVSESNCTEKKLK